RLRSRTTKPASPAKVTHVMTKKAKESSVKPVRYGAKKSWSKVVPPSEKKKTVLKKRVHHLVTLTLMLRRMLQPSSHLLRRQCLPRKALLI
ncbi:hypothetical protein A2U01_0066816, partial [Trifolium medium]|nr:hypothetical protein [Trifolium medium]